MRGANAANDRAPRRLPPTPREPPPFPSPRSVHAGSALPRRVPLSAWLGSLKDWFLNPRSRAASRDLRFAAAPKFRVVCISRESGAGGATIGRLVAGHLRWRFYDQEIVDTIARRMKMTPEEARVFDELAPTRVQAWALPVLEEHYAPHEAYLDHLEKLIDAIGRAGDSVIVGRGAGFVLPRETTLGVRIVAPLAARAERLAERMGVSIRTARRAALDLDRRREKFSKLQLGVDATDPRNYDLVLNSHSLGLDVCAAIILNTIRTRALVAESQPALPPLAASPALAAARRDEDDGKLRNPGEPPAFPPPARRESEVEVSEISTAPPSNRPPTPTAGVGLNDPAAGSFDPTDI